MQPTHRTPPQGAQKDMGLHQYASRFAAAGIAAFVIDYRTFGGSDGEPRNWISPKRHLQDWRSAIAYVKETLAADGVVDGGKLGLWGTSYGGGHALVMAGELRDNVSAVVAQVPFLDGKEALQRVYKAKGLVALLRRAAAGGPRCRAVLVDLVLRSLRLSNLFCSSPPPPPPPPPPRRPRRPAPGPAPAGCVRPHRRLPRV